MPYRSTVILASLAIAACAAPTTQSPEFSATGESLTAEGKPVAAEAVLVDGNVPAELKEAGLVDEDTLICRKEKRVGTHIPEVVCVSAEERDRLRSTSREYIDATKRTAGATPQNQ